MHKFLTLVLALKSSNLQISSQYVSELPTFIFFLHLNFQSIFSGIYFGVRRKLYRSNFISSK